MDKSFSPVYQAFHEWLKKNRGKIKAGRNETVIYSGMDSGGVPEWKKLDEHARTLKKTIGYDVEWQPIEQVLRKLSFDLTPYKGDFPLPASALRFKSAWDFGRKISSKNYVSRAESQQVWKSFSAWYAKNSSGHVWMFKGDRLKAYPDMFLAEIPVLLRRNDLTPENERQLLELIPDLQKVVEAYRTDTFRGRKAGR